MELTIVALDTVATNSDMSGQGTDWGAHNLRLVRCADGTLYTTYLAGNPKPWRVGPDGVTPPGDDYYKTTRLLRRDPATGQWATIAQRETGYTSGELLRLQNDTVVVVCSPSGVVSVWNPQTGLCTPLPGNWQVTSWPYLAAGMEPDGRAHVLQSQITGNPSAQNKPGLLAHGTLRPDGTPAGDYTLFTLPGGRYAYNHLFPQADGTIDVIGLLAVKPEEAGYPPSSVYAYTWTDPGIFNLNPNTGAVAGPFPFFKGTTWTDANGNTAYPGLAFGDAFDCGDGSYLILFGGTDGSIGGRYGGWTCRIHRDGSLIEAPSPCSLPYANQARMSRLGDGSIVAYVAEPAGTLDGVTAQPVALHWMSRSGPAAAWSAVQSAPIEGWTWTAYPENEYNLSQRSGSVQPADGTVYVVCTAGPGACARVGQFRFPVGGIPQPAADLTPRLATLEAAVTTLTQSQQALRAEVGALQATLRGVQQALAG